MNLLKRSTAAAPKIGPFIDDTDGKTAETTLTISQANVRLSKNGGDMAQKNESSACTHDELGYYACPIDTTDTGSLGHLKLMVHMTGALPVWHEYLVIPTNVFNALVAGSEYFGVNAIQIEGGDATDAINDACSAALLTYDAPTKAELDAGFAALNNVSAGTITDLVSTALLTYDAPTKAELDAAVAALNNISGSSIVDLLMAEVTDGALTYKTVVQAIFAAVAGKTTGGGTASLTFRDAGDGLDRIEATVDGDGNRSAITVNADA